MANGVGTVQALPARLRVPFHRSSVASEDGRGDFTFEFDNHRPLSVDVREAKYRGYSSARHLHSVDRSAHR